MNLWTSKDAVKATNGISKINWVADGISIDTRNIKPGDLFVALKDKRDGHEFVKAAFEKGASAALVSKVPDGVNENFPLLVVEDVFGALQSMAKFARARTKAKIIGITGSVGKTSTKEMLKTILTENGKTHAAEKSYNNHWGVPLTLARMPKNSDFAIIEIGMNSPNEIRPLAKLAALDVAIVLNVAPVHLKAFKNVEEIAFAKAEIFENLTSKNSAIVNNDLSTTQILLKTVKAVGANLVTFGQKDKSDFRLVSSTWHKNKTSVKAKINDQNIHFDFCAEGDHFSMNALAAFAAAELVGADRKITTQAFSNWQAPKGRGERKKIKFGLGNIELIDESYNANPISMAAALKVLSNSKSSGRKIAILGEMGELGVEENLFHSDLARIEGIKEIDVFYLVGPLMRFMWDELPDYKESKWFESIDELIMEIGSLIAVNDTIMVKGSNYTKVSKIVEAIKKVSV